MFSYSSLHAWPLDPGLSSSFTPMTWVPGCSAVFQKPFCRCSSAP